MNFERLSFQSWFEGHVGCTDLDKWEDFQKKIEEINLETEFLKEALIALDRDAASLMHKSVLTFVGAYNDLLYGHRSWAVVKLYYSLFYTLRSRLCSRRHGMIRNKSWFHFDLNFKKCSGKKLSSKRYRNDHESTLNLYQDIFEKSDTLISNKIDGKQPFSWMMDLRNVANYRLARFTDPDFPFELPNDQENLNSDALEKLLNSIINDHDLKFLFQAEYAWIGLPVRQIIATFNDLTSRNQYVELNLDQYNHTIKCISNLPASFTQAFDPKKIFILNNIE
ncbi:hypothetical protein [Janthinobacterium sp. LB2P10]|uniref:hypothetical protein n=1 Tax=Janthinobacterium sp. LB2P10 TaxID=3424194 RepID=UPI003F202B06